MFLEKGRLEKYSRKLKSMGIRCLADLELMEVLCFCFFRVILINSHPQHTDNICKNYSQSSLLHTVAAYH
jgi:hypothetical protein